MGIRQLLPTVLDHRAQNHPQEVFAKIPVSPTTYSQGFRLVTYIELVRAIDRLAWLLEEKFGKTNDFPTIAYIGPSDLRYSIVVVAAIKAGYKTFLPSPRNSKTAHIALLKRLNCTRLVVTTPEAPCVPQIVESYAVEKLVIPSLGDLLNSTNDLVQPRYPYTKTCDEAKDDPVFILHTSGSTGIPKPLHYTNSFVSAIATNTSLEPPEDYHMLDRFFRTGSFFMTLPGFHVAGIGFSLIVPSFQHSVPVYPLPTAPPTTEGLIEAASFTDIDWAFVPPVVVDQLAHSPELLDSLSSKLKHLFYTGGNVPKASGDIVMQKMGLYQCLGSSECATFPLIRPLSDQTCAEWNYVQIHPAIKHDFRHRFDDLHELVVIKSTDHEMHQPVFQHFPGTTEYETRDLFSRHPTKPDLWTHRGRIDDVIVFLNGEKTNPISFEQEVTRHPEVRAALVGGEQRFEAFLLIELVSTEQLSDVDKAQILDRLWPTVELANKVAPAHARVAKNKILFADPGKPFPRAGKGTVQRRAAIDLYAQEIEENFRQEEQLELNSESVLAKIDFTDQDAVIQLIVDSVKAVTNWNEVELSTEFFGAGMDSLQVLRLTRELKAKFGLSNVAVRNVYANPSVELLANEIMALAVNKQSVSAIDDSKNLELVLSQYTQKIDRLAAEVVEHTPKANGTSEKDTQRVPKVVLLTGSTGTLGSYLLHELLSDPSISHIHCLDRSLNSIDLQLSRSGKLGLSTSISSERVSFHRVDLTKPNFGLDKSTSDVLTNNATQIIHNAWPVDFNKTLHSFRPNLDGVLNLAVFAAEAKHSPSILFISSISSVINYRTHGSVPEQVITDLTAPASMGYGQSKYLAERILDHAAQKLHINTGAVRVGQICGTMDNPRGWSRNEWYPSLVLSSRKINVLPESLGSTSKELPDGLLGDIDWIPIDYLPKIVLGLLDDLSSRSTSGPFDLREGLKVFHAVSPHPVPWRTLTSTATSTLNTVRAGSETNRSHKEMEVVPYAEWLNALRSSATGGDGEIEAGEVKQNPGLKLMDFYESLLKAPESEFQSRTAAKLDLTQTLEVSPALKSLEAVKEQWLAGWIKNWFASGDA